MSNKTNTKWPQISYNRTDYQRYVSNALKYLLWLTFAATIIGIALTGIGAAVEVPFFTALALPYVTSLTSLKTITMTVLSIAAIAVGIRMISMGYGFARALKFKWPGFFKSSKNDEKVPLIKSKTPSTLQVSTNSTDIKQKSWMCCYEIITNGTNETQKQRIAQQKALDEFEIDCPKKFRQISL